MKNPLTIAKNFARAMAIRALWNDAQGVQASYDATKPSRQTDQHWAGADGLSAMSANTPAVRKRLRDMSRYECENNCYAKGTEDTVADDLVGTGPRLQINDDDEAASDEIESRWREWAEADEFNSKLRLKRKAENHDGEAFALMSSDPNAPTPVKLTIIPFEAEQCADPTYNYMTPIGLGDGVELDKFGRPVKYRILNNHPGNMWAAGMLDYRDVPAAFVIHSFVKRRPGQIRGIPEITPALNILAQLRDFTSSVLAAARSAADISIILHTRSEFFQDTALLPAFDPRRIPRGALMALPEGYDAKQFEAKQPTTTYGDFKSELISEFARCMQLPYNIAAGNSSAHNRASAQFDGGIYLRAIEVRRDSYDTHYNSRIFRAWLREAVLINGFFSAENSASIKRIQSKGAPHTWRWPGFAHTDPTKEAAASAARLLAGISTASEECGKDGNDYRDVFRQQAVERKMREQLGLPMVDGTPAQQPNGNQAPPANETQQQ